MDGIILERVGGEEDMDDGMTCINHPFRKNPGGICAFCLQEKLGKLVCSSSSFPHSNRVSASGSPPPFPPTTFRSDIASTNAHSHASVGSSSSVTTTLSVEKSHHGECNSRKTRIPFLMAKKSKKTMGSSTSLSSVDSDIVFKRSKSTTTLRRRGEHFLDAQGDDEEEEFGRRKRGGFWSFLYLSSKTNSSKKTDKSSRNSRNNVIMPTSSITLSNGSSKAKEKCTNAPSLSLSKKSVILEDEDDSPNSQATASVSSFERKVSRSRSVGCGSRSFSGDFFERISTGFGDCTLRRVESQREGKARMSTSGMKERVKCGGIFGGFIMTSSSSSSSYWVSSSAEDMNGKPTVGTLAHGRHKSWAWTLASPMRAFSKPSSKDGKKDILNNANSNKKTTPNLDAIPSLLAVRS